MLARYNETYTHYTSRSGNTQILLYRRQDRQKRKEKLYYLKQKASGFLAVAVSVISPLLMDGDVTISVIMLPLGIYLLFTKEKVMMF